VSALYPCRYVFRATIQFSTPFLIGAGRNNDVADTVFVSDVNGLPTIPGSSLAGVVRSLFRETFRSEEDERELFGYQKGRDGSGSRLSVSWGVIHDSKNRPVEGIIDPDRLLDPVLARAQNPTLRDHVRLNHRGASDAEGRGKFDEQAVCAGHRFSFEMEMIGDHSHERLWQQLLHLLAQPGLRIGSRTRRGYGAFRFVHLASRVFDLTVRDDFDAYKSHPVSLATTSAALRNCDLPANPREDDLTLELEPLGHWMIGGGYDIYGDADMAPFRDCAITWQGDEATVCDDIIVIPATSIKGALAHRVAFHYNALTGIFADAETTEDSNLDNVIGANNLAVRELFGYCKDSEADSGDQGQRGRIIIDDIYLASAGNKENAQQIHHVGIDRFTGGARDQVLFSERPLWRGDPIKLQIDLVDIDGIRERETVLLAFKRSIRDLASGHLQFGAGSGRGLGRFQNRSEITWPPALAILEG